MTPRLQCFTVYVRWRIGLQDAAAQAQKLHFCFFIFIILVDVLMQCRANFTAD